MKYEIKVKGDGSHWMYRHGEECGHPNNAELQFWQEAQAARAEVERLLGELAAQATVIKTWDQAAAARSRRAGAELISRVTAGALGPVGDVNTSTGSTQANLNPNAAALKGGSLTPLPAAAGPVLVHFSAAQKEANA